jgi:cobyrinic acid a,c-diamide synthase
MILHLTRSSRLWTFLLLGFKEFQVRLQKKSAIFNRVKIKSHLCKVCDIINNKNVFVYLMIDNLNDLFPGKTAPLTYLVINYYLNRL